MGRSPCCDKNGLKKGPWTAEEDQLLVQYIQLHGPGKWRNLPNNAGLQRCGKSCRLRWTNYLRPDIKRGRFSFDEEETIIQLHSILGNKWSAIAARLPGRTDNEIKNYWNTHIRKRLLRMGMDPVTHSPRLDLLEYLSPLNNNLNAQINLSSLLGLQALLNPDLLRLLGSIASPSISSEAAAAIDNRNLFSEFQTGQMIDHRPVVMNQEQVMMVQPKVDQLSNVSGQTSPETCSPSRNYVGHQDYVNVGVSANQVEVANSSLEDQLMGCLKAEPDLPRLDSSGFSTLLSCPSMDFEIPMGSLDLSAYL